MTCDYCEKEIANIRLVQLWNGWIKRLCNSCIKELSQKWRYLDNENGELIAYPDKENELWGVTT